MAIYWYEVIKLGIFGIEGVKFGRGNLDNSIGGSSGASPLVNSIGHCFVDPEPLLLTRALLS